MYSLILSVLVIYQLISESEILKKFFSLSNSYECNIKFYLLWNFLTYI